MFSRISVLGVPGYAEANLTPASQAPRAIASFPDIKVFKYIPPTRYERDTSDGTPNE
jgi:hypothetical protein